MPLVAIPVLSTYKYAKMRKSSWASAIFKNGTQTSNIDFALNLFSSFFCSVFLGTQHLQLILFQNWSWEDKIKGYFKNFKFNGVFMISYSISTK
jgi:hypothetical protein